MSTRGEKKRCFVIAEFGKEGSDKRQRGDQVFSEIIKPAAKKCGYEAKRLLESAKPGMMVLEILSHLMNDDLVVADLTDSNPNVFYELGIRQMIYKPVIQMLEGKPEDLPFDVRGYKTIIFSREEGGIEAAKRKLIAQIRESEKEPAVENPISQIFAPFLPRVVEWQKFGLVELSPNWRDLTQPTGLGLELHKQLGKLHDGSIYYIVSTSPEGFAIESSLFREVITPAIARGAKVKWAYVGVPSNEDVAGTALRNWQTAMYGRRKPSQMVLLSQLKSNIYRTLDYLRSIVQDQIRSGLIPEDAIELYESSIPTTHLALLAVERTPAANSKGVALINPYVMFPVEEKPAHWGMILQSPGALYKEYAETIERFFDEGVRHNFLRRVPLIEE